MIVVVPGPIRSGLDSDSFTGIVDPGVTASLSRAGNSLVIDFSSDLTVDQRAAIVEMATQVVDPDTIERERLREIIEEDAPAGGGGSDGDPPSTAPTVTFIGGIGSIFFRWTEVANTDLVTYRLFVRDGSAPTTADDTYLVASGVGMTVASVRKLADGSAIVGDGSVTYYGIVVAEDADGPGPDSTTVSGVPAQVTSGDIAANAVTADMLVANDALIDALEVVDLTGTTLTGATVQTAATGERVVLRADGSQGVIEAYSGLTDETPANFNPSTFSSRPSLIIQAGTLPTMTDNPSLIFVTGDTDGDPASSALLGANQITLEADDVFMGALLGATLHAVMGGGDVGTGTFRDSVDARVELVTDALDIRIDDLETNLPQSGVENTGTLVANTDKTIAVAFPVAFSTAPVVQLTPQHLANLNNPVAYSAQSITTTGFNLVVRRATTSAVDMGWTAQLPT